MIKTLTMLAYALGHMHGFMTDTHAFHLAYTQFFHHHHVPVTYTCQGKNVAPDLSWRNLPRGTKSVALLLYDVDAPSGAWYHWGVYNISPQVQGLHQGKQALPKGARVAVNSWGHAKYEGPCHVSHKPHRYLVRVYALDSVLDTAHAITATELRHRIHRHVLASDEMLSRY